MRRALVLATVAALAVAKPEMYREKEDFQYSRSSSDEGTKSGFYDAQRGNMGGNYERAHNMDLLAQHQMGGLVRTVEGELGDGAKQPSGSVFSAASSRGIYGSGHYDLSNLQGRNFQEGMSLGGTQLSSLTSQQAGYGRQSQSYSAAKNAHSSQSENSRYHDYGYNTGSDQALYSNLHSADNLHSANQHDRTQSARASGYQSGLYQGQSYYDQAAASQQSSNAYGSSSTRGAHYRLVGASPVKVYIRPGNTVAIPVAAQSYVASQGSSSAYDNKSRSSSSTLNQNAINSESEVLGTAYKPTNGAKHYESSYSYRKEWEKHDTITSAPFTVPTINPYPPNSELYEDSQVQGSKQREVSAQSNSEYRGYNTKSASSRQQAAYNSQRQEHSSLSDTAAASHLASSSSNSHGGAYNSGFSANLNSANLNSQVENFGSKPKSYQSSYSYHKSWERQGDPYTIKPATNGLYTDASSQASQRLTSSLNQASNYGSHRYDSRYQQGQQGYTYDPNCDCYDNGHIRVARSYNLGHGRGSYQQSQNIYGGQEYMGQQSQNLEDLGQQSQNLEDFGQQSQNLENFGQQPQDLLDFGQQSQNLEDLGQQSQNLEDFGQQSQKLEDLGQQTQALGQDERNFDRLEDLGQQAQNEWDQQSQTDAGQQTQNIWSMLETIQHNHADQNTRLLSGMDPTGYNNQGTQGSVIEINYPPMNRPDSQTIETVNPNSLTPPIFYQNQYSQPPEIQKHYWQTLLSMDHNSQSMQAPLSPWDFQEWQKHMQAHNSLNTGYGQHLHHDQTSYNTNTRNYQTSYNYNSHSPSFSNNINAVYAKPVFPTSYGQNIYTEYPKNVNTEFNTNPWNFPSPNYNTNTNLHNTEYRNVFTNTQTFTTRHNQSTVSTNDVNFPKEAGSSTLTNLWDLIDEIEQKTLRNETEKSYHMYQDNIEHNNRDFNFTQTFDKTMLNNADKFNSIAPQPSTTEPNSKTTIIKQDTFRPVDAERGDIEPEKLKPQEEAGRGDIGPEDNKPLEVLGMVSTKPQKPTPTNTLEKTPEEIETLSLTKEQNNTKFVNSQSINTETLGVLSLDDQKKLEHSEHDNWKIQSDKQRTTPRTIQHHEYFNIEQVNQQNQHVDLDQQNTDDIVNGERQLDQGNVNTDKQHVNDFVSFQQNTDQQFETMGQETESFNQQSLNKFEDLGQQTEELGYDHQKTDNFGQQSEGFQQESLGNFGQESENLGQKSEGFQQESLDNFGQQSEGFQQESLGNFGQQSEGFQHERLGNFGQESENLGQQSEGFQQESLGNFGQQSEGFQQESLGNFGQQSEGFQPENLDNFGQQSEGFQHESLGNFGQETENLGQQSEDFQQESLGNFGQQREGFQQENLGNFGQQSEGFQHESLGNFEKESEHLEQHSDGFHQESLGHFGQQSENLGQEIEGFQQKSLDNIGQQSENVGQSEGFQQESLGYLGQQSEGFHPERFGNFGQENGNLRQQIEGFQQESLGNFGQQSEGFQQESLSSFGQQSEPFQRENLNNFGQDENLGQEIQQLNNIGQQSTDFQEESFLDSVIHEQLQGKAKELQRDNMGKRNENLEQKIQYNELWNPNSDKQLTPQVETFVPSSAFENEDKISSNNKPVLEPEFKIQKINNVDTPSEPVTEQPGFWSKVSSKVKSWFSRD